MWPLRMACHAKIKLWQNQIYRLHVNTSLPLTYPTWNPPKSATEITDTIQNISLESSVYIKQVLFVKLMFQLNYLPNTTNLAALDIALMEIL